MEIQIYGKQEIDKEKVIDLLSKEFLIPKELIKVRNVDFQTAQAIDWDKLYEEFKAGTSIQQICFKYRVSNTTIRNKFIMRGWIPNTDRKTKLTVEEKQQLYKDWNQGMSANELSAKYKVTATYIRLLMKSSK